MPRGKFPRTKKDPFADLPEDFKEAVNTASAQQLKERLSEVTKAEEANLAAAKADEDLQQAKDSVKVASEGYRELTKLNKLKRKFIINSMATSGDDVAQQIVRLNQAAGK